MHWFCVQVKQIQEIISCIYQYNFVNKCKILIILLKFVLTPSHSFNHSFYSFLKSSLINSVLQKQLKSAKEKCGTRTIKCKSFSKCVKIYMQSQILEINF